MMVDKLSINTINFDPELPWSVRGGEYRSDIAFIKISMLNRLKERLGDRYNPASPGATLTVRLTKVKLVGGPIDPSIVWLSARFFLADGGVDVTYKTGMNGVPAVLPGSAGSSSPLWKGPIPEDAKDVTDSLFNQMLSK